MIKNLKSLFGSIFVLLFIFISIANTVIFASFRGYFSDSEIYYGDYSRENLHELELRQNRLRNQKSEPLNWEFLCDEIAKLSGETVTFEFEDQQLMVCRNLYLLFNIDIIEETKRNLKDIFSLLCENDENFYLCLGDKNLSCKINRILEKRSQREFYNLYQKFMSKLRIRAKDKINVRRVDALLLLSYMYLLCGTDMLPRDWIFNVGEEADLIVLLNKIFSNTFYEPILKVFPFVPPLH